MQGYVAGKKIGGGYFAGQKLFDNSAGKFIPIVFNDKVTTGYMGIVIDQTNPKIGYLTGWFLGTSKYLYTGVIYHAVIGNLGGSIRPASNTTINIQSDEANRTGTITINTDGSVKYDGRESTGIGIEHWWTIQPETTSTPSIDAMTIKLA